MKEKIQRFLKENNFLPIAKWQHFEIVHKGISLDKFQKKIDLSTIKTQVSRRSGLYIYEKNRKIIYIGKAKSLFDRIKNHYISAYQEVPGDTKDKIWHKFFSSKRNLCKLRIYWREEKNERNKQIVEKMLDYVLNPTFNTFREKHTTKSRGIDWEIKIKKK